MVTCGTYQKAHFLNTPDKLDRFRNLFFSCAVESPWDLHAWAILSNHYHFIASSPTDAGSLRRMLSKLHTLSARDLNAQDCQAGRKVWFQFFDSHLTFTNSYLARLRYVHHNPVHHGVLACAENYPWCSAAWFARTAKPAFRATVERLKTDTLSVVDDFIPKAPEPSAVICGASSCAAESGVKPCSLYASCSFRMGISAQGPAACHVHESAHADSEALGTGFAIKPPSRIAAQSRHQPVGFPKRQRTSWAGCFFLERPTGRRVLRLCR